MPCDQCNREVGITTSNGACIECSNWLSGFVEHRQLKEKISLYESKMKEFIKDDCGIGQMYGWQSVFKNIMYGDR
jgi:hypothetical protein